MSKFDYQQFSRDVIPTEAAFDGQLRKLSQGDFAMVRNHFVRLDRDSLYHRFGCSVSDETLARHVDAMRDPDATIFGCWISGRIRGVGEQRRFEADGELRAEAALTVERNFQELGLGKALMARMIEEAERLDVRKILVAFDFRDHHMRRIVEQAEASLHFEGTDCLALIAVTERSGPEAPRDGAF